MDAYHSRISWWLDYGALPGRLLWARLEVAPNGPAVVFDLDGRYHRFEDEQAAKSWLLEDEYSLLAHLIEEGEVSSGLVPPTASSDQDLLRLMTVELARTNP